MKRGRQIAQDNSKVKVIIAVLISVVLIISLYFTFFYVNECYTSMCFNKALAKCSKVKFTNPQEEATWIYTIDGRKADSCIVNVKSVKVTIKEAREIENKEMKCYLPKGLVMAPESELDSCHGLLKEELQNIIIEKLHVYIVQNIGQISGNIKNPL
ncbi:MAG: hypothetical protein V1660_02965 [archaeon]